MYDTILFNAKKIFKLLNVNFNLECISTYHTTRVLKNWSDVNEIFDTGLSSCIILSKSL